MARFVRICLIGSGRENIYALADPAKSEQYAQDDLARMRQVVSKLTGQSVCLVCVVRGGFVDCLRECSFRGVHTGIEGGLGGNYQRACEAYSALDFENTTSVARFLCEHVTNFEPPKEDDLVRVALSIYIYIYI